MSTTTLTEQTEQKKVIACPVAEDVLRGFLHPKHDVLKDICTLWNLRGDGTESDARRLRHALGPEAYEHYNWDTAVSNGRVLILIPRFKHPEGVKPRFGFHFPAEWFWCFSQIDDGEDVVPASAEHIARVPEELRESLKVLPELEWMTVTRVNYFSHGNGKPKAKHQPAPDGIAFFRFKGGLGLSVSA